MMDVVDIHHLATIVVVVDTDGLSMDAKFCGWRFHKDQCIDTVLEQLPTKL